MSEKSVYAEQDKKRLLVDMDGTLATFKNVDTLETLYEQGYFQRLKPVHNVVDAVKILVKSEPSIEVYIISAVLKDSKFALQEKQEWLDRYLPEIPRDRRIFTACGEDKKNFVPGGIRSTDYLLDDYTKNLASWEPPAKGIKILNGINHTQGTWHGSMLSILKPAEKLARDICDVMEGEMVRDPKPGEWRQRMVRDMEHDIQP